MYDLLTLIASAAKSPPVSLLVGLSLGIVIGVRMATQAHTDADKAAAQHEPPQEDVD